jgi:hypothetical protein
LHSYAAATMDINNTCQFHNYVPYVATFDAATVAKTHCTLMQQLLWISIIPANSIIMFLNVASDRSMCL